VQQDLVPVVAGRHPDRAGQPAHLAVAQAPVEAVDPGAAAGDVVGEAQVRDAG
jgi:hypothetical protein